MIETRPSFQVQSRRRSSVADEEAPAATDDIVTSLAQRAKDLGNEAFRKQVGATL